MKTFTTTCTILALCIIIFSQCSPKKNADQKQIPATTPEVKASVAGHHLTKRWATDSILKTPESVIYDAQRDVLYVSNVNEHPWEKDHNGFISKLATDGEIMTLEWIAGFSGPKGMAIVGDTLYVADIDAVGVIDLNKEKLVRKIAVDGASGLNDITSSQDGTLYISDSNEGRIYKYAHGKMSIFDDQTPGRPNGLLAEADHLMVAFSKAATFIQLDLATHHQTVVTKNIGSGDGVTPTPTPGEYLVSDWNGEIFYIRADGTKQSLLNTKDQQSNTADICYLQKENLLLVPTFFANRVVAYRLE